MESLGYREPIAEAEPAAQLSGMGQCAGHKGMDTHQYCCCHPPG